MYARSTPHYGNETGTLQAISILDLCIIVHLCHRVCLEYFPHSLTLLQECFDCQYQAGSERTVVHTHLMGLGGGQLPPLKQQQGLKH